MKLVDTYIEYLSKNANLVHGFFFMVVFTLFVWFVTWKFRERIIKGLEGENKIFQAGEVVIFVTIWCTPPILFYIVFFTEKYLYGLLFLAGVLGYALMGRYLFDWALAFKSGKSEVIQIVDPEQKETKVTTTTETVTK